MAVGAGIGIFIACVAEFCLKLPDSDLTDLADRFIGLCKLPFHTV